MTRRLEISIKADGTISAEASGTPGPECLEALDQLRRLLNAEVSDSKPTPEFTAMVGNAQRSVSETQQVEGSA